MDKLGVFICSGCGIGDALDVDAVKAVAEEGGAKCAISHPWLCENEGLEAIRSAVADNSLDGILLAACSDRAKVSEFEGLTSDDGPAPAQGIIVFRVDGKLPGFVRLFWRLDGERDDYLGRIVVV